MKTSRIRAIDGLRALAIMGVIFYHMRLPWLPSGHLGVVIFLVLGGYFATTTIVRAFEEKGFGFDKLAGLWISRLRRIWPSVVALVAFFGVLCTILNRVLLTKMRPDALPSIGFFLNLSYIVRQTSYFDQIGGTSPLLHLWYLGVDLQFFLLWSIVCSVVLRFGRRALRIVALVLAMASAVWMYVCYVPGGDPSRVYYGTDTRAFSLLLGAWLALAFPLGKMPLVGRSWLVRPLKGYGRRQGAPRYKASLKASVVGLLSLLALVWCMMRVPADDGRYYQGGFLAVSIAVTALLATLLAPKSLLSYVFCLPPIRWIGSRSFALYLWHYPIVLLMEANKTTTPWYLRLVAVLIALIAAEVSTRVIEHTFAAGGRTTEGPFEIPRVAPWHRTAVAALIVMMSGVTAWALVTLPDETLVPAEAIVSTGEAVDHARVVSAPESPAESVATPDESPVDDNAERTEEASGSEKNEKATEPVVVEDNTVVYAPGSESSSGIFDPVLIGDSVPGDAVWTDRLPNILSDCFIGRRPDQAVEVFKGYESQGVVGKVVVFATFSNTTPTEEQLDTLVATAGPERRVFLVGTFNPDGFQEAANEALRACADRYENVTYVDWPAIVSGHEGEYLWADVTHLRPEGAIVYVDMVVRAIAQAMVDIGGAAGPS